MKKENKSRFVALTKYLSSRNEKIKNCICALLSFTIVFILVTASFPLVSNEDMTACKEELVSYLASPSRYDINTDKYTIKISNNGTTLSINGTVASCTAVFDITTNNYNYSYTYGNLVTIIFWILITILCSFFGFFILLGFIAIITDVCKSICKHYKTFRREYSLNKAEADLNITREEAEKYELSIQQKQEFDEAYKKGYDTGYTDGRSKGFKQGQYDAYEEGYAKGYTDGQDELVESINSFMNEEEVSCNCEDTD